MTELGDMVLSGVGETKETPCGIVEIPLIGRSFTDGILESDGMVGAAGIDEVELLVVIRMLAMVRPSGIVLIPGSGCTTGGGNIDNVDTPILS
jgi:hypothetical protein